MDIKEKIAIITGATSGIGLATARLLAKNGAKVVLVARSKNILKKLSKELPNSLAITTDMTNFSQVKKMVKIAYDKFGRIDILINNAGCGYDVPVEKIDLKKFRYLIDLNLIGLLIAMQEVIPIMRKQKGGSIVNISSGTSLMQIPNISAYSSLKRALNGLSLTARDELARDNIIVSLVYPYITATNFAKNIMGGARRWDRTERDNDLPSPDSPEYVAEKILEAVKSGKAEIFAHDWMKKRLS